MVNLKSVSPLRVVTDLLSPLSGTKGSTGGVLVVQLGTAVVVRQVSLTLPVTAAVICSGFRVWV